MAYQVHLQPVFNTIVMVSHGFRFVSINNLSRVIILLLFAPFVFTTCDIIEVNEIEKDLPTEPFQSNKNVLLEYFSGHKCVNCPGQSGPVLQRMEELYGKHVVIITIHEGIFAEPYPGAWNLDLRSTAGKSIFDSRMVTAVPTGVIDRHSISATALVPPAGWINKIAERFELDAATDIDIRLTPSQSGTNGIINVSYTFYKDFNEALISFAYITEDSIIGLQSDNRIDGGIDSNFVFNHVLRSELISVNSPFATPTAISNDSTYYQSFNYTLLPLWKRAQINVVIILTDASGVVLQAKEFKDF